MKKQIASLLACAMLLLSLVGCGSMYHEADMIGKTSAQIEAEFGRFDCCGMPAGADGLYRNTACGYTIQEAKANFLPGSKSQFPRQRPRDSLLDYL